MKILHTPMSLLWMGERRPVERLLGITLKDSLCDGKGWGGPFFNRDVCCHVLITVSNVVGDFLWDSNQLKHICNQVTGMDLNAFIRSRKVIKRGKLHSCLIENGI